MSMMIGSESGVIIVTGGAGFIGSAVVRELLANSDCTVVNVDCLTYAGNLATLDDIAESKRYIFGSLPQEFAFLVQQVPFLLITKKCPRLIQL